MSRRQLLIVLILLLAAASPTPAFAQDRPGQLRGTVKDQTGGVIAGANVSVAGPSGRSYTTRTDREGRFRVDEIAPGLYAVIVAHALFAPFSAAIEVGPAPLEAMEITLFVAINLQESVIADIGVSPGNLSSLVLRREELATLPSNPRLFWQRLAEMAGATGRPGDLTVYVDGFRNSVRLPPRDTIEMIRINANAFAAEFPEPSKGRVEIVTRPGSETFLGEVALNFSDESLNARNPFATSKPSEQYRRYSGYVGGPLVRGRWGFLVYGGRWEQDENAVVYATTIDPPTLQSSAVTETVPTPFRTTSVAIKGHSLAGAGNIATMLYERKEQVSDNQGVGGTSLTEHAFDRTTSDDVVQLALVSFSPRMLNDLRVELTRQITDVRARTTLPEVMVFDAFTGGGNQHSLFTRNATNNISILDTLTRPFDRHTIKAGAGVTGHWLHETNRANFGGQFTFGGDFERDAQGARLAGANGQLTPISPLENYRRTLAGLPGYGPSQFVVSRGDPEARLRDARIAWFVQDDWQVAPNMTLSYGIRHDLQAEVGDWMALGPRAGVVWSPGSSGLSTVRAGSGLFYTNVPLESLLESVRLDGTRQQRVVVQQPSFFPQPPPELTGEVSLASTFVRAPELRVGRVAVTSVTYERQLPRNMFVASGYTWRRGSHLLRSRNINAPPAGSPLRPMPDRGPVFQLESTGSSSRHELDVRWRQNVSTAITTYATYTIGSSRSDTDGPQTVPASSYYLATEFGSSADDLRHQVVTGGTITAPWGWSISLYATASSAPPLNITTGRDNNFDTSFTDRPAVARPGDPEAIVTPFGIFNPSPADAAGIIPRNTARQAGRVDFSLSIVKRLGRGFTSNVDATNLFNHTHRTVFNGVLGSPDFGQATQALPARRIEVGVTKTF